MAGQSASLSGNSTGPFRGRIRQPESDTFVHSAMAGFAAAEVDKHFDSGRYGRLDRHEARLQARRQADYLWQQPHGQY
jgi:hypothetical protein